MKKIYKAPIARVCIINTTHIIADSGLPVSTDTDDIIETDDDLGVKEERPTSSTPWAEW